MMSAYAAQKWVCTYNTTPPIVYLDTNSIKRFNSGAVYNVRYINKDNIEVLAQIYTDLNGNASVLSALNYDESKKYDTYKISNNIKMKTITSDSSIYNSLQEVQNSISSGKIKFCAPDKCSFVSPNTIAQSETLSEPDFGPYMRELQKRIKANWYPPKGNESKQVVLLFSISKDGRLSSIKVHKSSGLTAADNAAMTAVKLTAPFKPLPAGFKGQSVDIQFTFDYNVLGGSLH